MNAWATRMTETMPDGSTRVTYANAYGAPMLVAFTPAGASSPDVDYYRYSSAVQLVLHANPSAVSGYSESYADLVNYTGGAGSLLRASSGLVETTNYGSTTTATSTSAGDVGGFVSGVGTGGMTSSTAIQQGQTGTSVPQEALAYIANTVGAATFYWTATDTRYRNTNGTGAQTTTSGYTFWSGTNAAASITTTLPAVTTAENGSGTANSSVVVLDTSGRDIWSRDAAGFIDYLQYDDATGAVTKSITDVNTALTSTFSNLPSGWSTPSGGGLHLTTTYAVDALGRATRTGMWTIPCTKT